MTLFKQANGVLLVLGSLLVIQLLVWLMRLTPLPEWQRGLHWNYASHILMIGVPLLALLLLRRSPADYGIAPRWAKHELRLCALVCPILVAIPIAGGALYGDLALKHSTLPFVVSTIVFQVVFSGFGEELLFRGYFQGELNRVFPRNFQLFGVECGWGLIIVSVLFGLAHLFNPFNPFVGQYEFHLWSMILTGIAGMIFGLVRERFNSILAASLIHGSWDLGLAPFKQTMASNIALGVSIFIVCWILGESFSKPLPEPAKVA